ncbi:MAG: 30S ribosomal protein S6 [Candidatus Adiutrix sp.]|jgi:small subunit ribosomal protein S6|nr:30S ribosomal protein S6 [Candidatus Adiutrix sp.]
MHPRRYETLIMLAPNLEAAEFDAFKSKVDNIMAAGGGQLVSFEDWGRRRLSYPVKKEMFGHYLLYDFQGRPELSTELERNLKIDEKVFKYLTLVLDKKFTDEDLAAAREKLLADAARREAEKAKAREAAEARQAAGEETDDDQNDGGQADVQDSGDDEE